MLNIKKLISLIITIIIVIASIFIPAFAIDNEYGLDSSSEHLIDIEDKKEDISDENLTVENELKIKEFIKNRKPDIILEIERLNYNNPIMLKKGSNNNFYLELWEKFYELGKVTLAIESDSGTVAFHETLSDEQHNINVYLESHKDYIYDIKVDCEDGSSIFYLGEILEDEDGNRFTNILARDQGYYDNMPIASDTQAVEKYEQSRSLNNDASNLIVPMSVKGNDVWEVEPDNNMSQAITFKNNDNVHGIMNGDRVDYYKVVFGRDGKVNFWLGNIPSGKPHYLYVYEGSSSYPKWSSTYNSTTQQLISAVSVKKNTIYYVKVEYPNGTLPIYGDNYWLRAKMLPDLYWPGPTSPTLPSNISCCYECPQYGYGSPHIGIDIIGSKGQSIYSVLDGEVSIRKNDSTSGNQILIEHPDNPVSSSTGTYLRTFYCHMNSEALYGPKTQVWAKQLIGYVGNTGIGTGAHLHFGAYYSNNGTSWYRFNPLKLWSGRSFKCNTCGKYRSQSIALDDLSYNNTDTDIFDLPNMGFEERQVGITINDTTIDIETLINMPEIDIERFGLKQTDLEKFSGMISNDSEYNSYLNNINSMSIK